MFLDTPTSFAACHFPADDADVSVVLWVECVIYSPGAATFQRLFKALQNYACQSSTRTLQRHMVVQVVGVARLGSRPPKLSVNVFYSN